MKLQKILITTDLSLESFRPLEAVHKLALQVEAELTLLYIVPDMSMLPHGAPFAPALHPIDLDQEVASAKEKLKEHVAALDPRPAIEVIVGSEVHQAICDYADGNDFDLLAISTHGRTGLRRLALGSVVELVVRHASTPVLTFHRP